MTLTGRTKQLIGAVAAIWILAGCGTDLSGTVEFVDETTTSQGSAPPTTATTTTDSPTGPTTSVDASEPITPATTAPAQAAERRNCRSSEALADVVPVGLATLESWPRPDPSPTTLSRVPASQKYLTLSFDAEQDPASVPELLEVLASHGIRTNFFVLGPWAEANPDLVRAIHEAGHEIGNHAYTHERMGEWEPEDFLADLERAEAVLTELTGQSTRPWFRPPFGNRTDASVQTAFAAGWTTVTWSNGSNDFVEGSPAEVEDSICADLLEGAEPGAVLISHTFNPQTPAAVDRFIREMHDLDYVFVPLSVLTAPDPTEFVVMIG